MIRLATGWPPLRRLPRKAGVIPSDPALLAFVDSGFVGILWSVAR